MKKMRKSTRILTALMLVLVMLVSLLPLLAVAEGEGDGEGDADPHYQIDEHGGASYYQADGSSTGPDGDWSVSMSKTISDTDADGNKLRENQFAITLMVQTVDDIDDIPSPDIAVVLVIDISSSMKWKVDESTQNPDGRGTYWGNGGAVYGTTAQSMDYSFYKDGTSRMARAKVAARDFLDSYIEDAAGAARWVSIISFGTQATIEQSWIDISDPGNMAVAKAAIDKLYVYNDTATGNGTQYTYLQGGLGLAQNLITTTSNGINDMDYRYVVTLTDGSPTYSKSSLSGDTGKIATGNTITDGATNGTASAGEDPVEYNANVRIARERAEIVADSIKSDGTKIFTVGLSLDPDRKFDNYATTSTNPKAIGDTQKNATDWLTGYIASPATATDVYHFDAGSEYALKLAFSEINNNITQIFTQAWTVRDKMGDWIVYEGEKEATNLRYDEDEDALTWRLRSWPHDEVTGTNGKTVRVYKYTYLITLDNLDEEYFEAGTKDSNDYAVLFYTITDTGDVNWFEKYFDVPSVHGFEDSTFTFYKEGSDGRRLNGYEFTLTHSEGCPCGLSTLHPDFSRSEKSEITLSGEHGVVHFDKIPSGHVYILSEVSTINPYPELYKTSVIDHILTVSYGTHTIDPEILNDTVLNDAKDIEITLNKLFLFNEDDISKIIDDETLGMIVWERELTCTEEHVHDDDCYSLVPHVLDGSEEYEFIFTLMRKNEGEDDELGQTSIKLTRDELVNLLLGDGKATPTSLTLRGEDRISGALYWIVETPGGAGYPGWTFEPVDWTFDNGTSITVGVNEVDIHNTFGTLIRPHFVIEKKIEYRRYGALTEDQRTFTFELWSQPGRGGNLIGEYTLTTNANDVGRKSVSLGDAFLNYSGTLYLSEVKGDFDDIMEYDNNEWPIIIENGIVISGTYATFTFNNFYTKPVGEMIISKEVIGVSAIPEDYYALFTVEGPGGYSKTFSYPKDFTDGELLISDLDPGEYSVTEISQSGITDYIHELSSVNREPTIVAGDRARVSFTNTYTYDPQTTPTTPTTTPTGSQTSNNSSNPQYGSLIINKVISGATPPDGYNATFTVSGPGMFNRTISYSDFTDGSYTLPRLSAGSYTVTETNATEIAGYEWSVSGSGNTVSVVLGQTASVTITNTYEAQETITPETTETPTPPVETDIETTGPPLGETPDVSTSPIITSPEATGPVYGDGEDDTIILLNPQTPLTSLPQTDGLSNIYQFLAMFGVIILVLGITNWVMNEEKHGRGTKKRK